MVGKPHAVRFFVAVVLLVALAACGHKKDLVPEVEPSGSPQAARLERYARIIGQAGAAYHVSPALIGAIVVVESGGNPLAQSPSGAIGLMQVKPATAARYGVTDLEDPAANVSAGTRYLRDLLARFHQSVELAVAAFKLGPAAIDPATGVPERAKGYVQRVMTAYQRILQAMAP